jgi:hypothetical protein
MGMTYAPRWAGEHPVSDELLPQIPVARLEPIAAHYYGPGWHMLDGIKVATFTWHRATGTTAGHWSAHR